jgi:hypothetical protein
MRSTLSEIHQRRTLCSVIRIVSIGISDGERLDVLLNTHSDGKTGAGHGHVTLRLKFSRYSQAHMNMRLHAKPADAKGDQQGDNVKKMILGSVAGILAIGTAQAADLPVKAKAVEYVRICSLYGAGFFYIPGTDTCIKLGGYLRVDTTFNGGPHGTPAWNGDLGQGNRYRDYFASRSRLAFTIDTRTATEYGVVRTFGQLDWSFTSPSGSFRHVGTTSNGQQINTVPLHPVRRLHVW